MYVFCFVCAALVVAARAGLTRPDFCPNGHKNRYLKRLACWTISFRKRCYDCGEQARIANALGGRRHNNRKVRQAHRGNVARSVRAQFQEYVQLSGHSVLYVEVWADRRSNVSSVAAREGSWVLRVSEASALHLKTQDMPTLVQGVATTAFLDLDSASEKTLLETWLPLLIQNSAPERVVLLTSPCCRLHSSLQHTNMAQWKQNLPTAELQVRLARFLAERRAARNAIRFAARLHSLVDDTCAECFGASGAVHCVHLHEQPSTARMAPVGVRADCLTGGVWPAAWTQNGDHADVPLCIVGYGWKTLKRYGKTLRFQTKGCDPLLTVLRKMRCQCTEPHDRCEGRKLSQTGIYSKILAYYLVLGTRCT